MRNPFSVLDWPGLHAALFGAAPHERSGLMRRYGTAVMVLALLCAGPVALLELFGGRTTAFLACAGLAFVTSVSVLLDRRGHGTAAGIVQVIGLSGVAALLAVSSGNIVNAGTLVSLATLLFALTALWPSQKTWVVLPLAAAFAGTAFQSGTLAAVSHTGGYVLPAIAALSAVMLSLAAFAVQARPAKLDESQPDPLSAIEDLVGAVVSYDSDGKLAHISPTGARLFHCRPYELANGGLFERVHILDRPAYAKALSDVRDKGGATCLELRLRDDSAQDGAIRYKWLELSLSGTAAHAQKPHDAIGIFRDIGVRKAIEDDLRRSRAEAEEASDAKTRFLATIGHELRTPLNAIVGFSDMMAEGIGGSLSQTHQDYTGHIRQSGHHLLEVVNMLLDMSKIEAGKFELQAEPFDPVGLVGPCMQMVEPIGRDRKVTLLSSVPDQLPPVVGDERSCRQIVINLLSNAIKFSHDGGQVTLAMRRQGRMLSIAVSDNGIGMTSDTVRRIGEPFLQAQNGLARQYEGTGLGLSIVKGLVSLHNGRMTVASEPDVGTRICVFLPLDGPVRSQPEATIQHLHPHRRDTDEQKWQEDEKRSATS